MEKYEMIATTLMGLEQVLAEEIRELGGENIMILKRAVKFFGDDSLLYKSNLALRTALKVLVPLADFSATSEEVLYQKIKSFPWEDIFSLNQTFSIEAIAGGNVFNHSKYVALKTKDAIADRFRQKFSRRPDVDTENPDVYIHIHINGSGVSVSLNSSGVGLDKRGYRKQANEAPINEVLAAGIIKMTGWNATQAFIDPMAGSGTFAIEAALLGTKMPPGLNRSFSFQNWNEFDSKLFEKVKFGLEKQISNNDLQIFARDISMKNIGTISENVERAGMEDFIAVKREDFFLSKPKENAGVIVMNPPYGERLNLSNTNLFYKQIGDTLRQEYGGYTAWVISSDAAALRTMGMKAEEKIQLMNGGLKALLAQFKIFEK